MYLKKKKKRKNMMQVKLYTWSNHSQPVRSRIRNIFQDYFFVFDSNSSENQEKKHSRLCFALSSLIYSVKIWDQDKENSQDYWLIHTLNKASRSENQTKLNDQDQKTNQDRLSQVVRSRLSKISRSIFSFLFC